MSLGVTQNFLSLHCNYAFLAELFQESGGMGWLQALRFDSVDPSRPSHYTTSLY